MTLTLLLIVIVVLLFLIYLAIQSEARVSRNTATHIWEYKVAPIGTREDTSDMQMRLSTQGRAGWELVNLIEITFGEHQQPGYAGIFKRPKEREILPIVQE